jgi:hypothetical protein
MKRLIPVLVTMALVTSSALRAEPLTIVEHGQARAAIVVQAGESKATEAGEQLQAYIEKMSGARLPLVQEGEAVPADRPVRLLVGQTRAARDAGVRFPAGYDTTIRPDIFEEEGYVLRTVGRDIIIGGNHDGPYNGTVYGACALLELLGCRWYFPGEWGQVVPERKTIVVPDLDVESRPDFASRFVSLSGWTPVSKEERRAYDQWATRIGMCPNPYPNVGDGFLAYLLPPNEYFETQPDFYAMDKSGKRHAGKHPTLGYYENHTMLCLSNPDVFTQSVKNLRAAFAGEKRLGNMSELGFGISPPDGTPYCFCPRAIASNS